jgi:hypothetical protein
MTSVVDKKKNPRYVMMDEESVELSPMKSKPLQKTMAVFQKRVLLKRAASRLGAAVGSKNRNLRLIGMTTRRAAVMGEGTSSSDGYQSATDDTDASSKQLLDTLTTEQLEPDDGVGPLPVVLDVDSADEPLSMQSLVANKSQPQPVLSVLGYKTEPEIDDESVTVSDVDSDDIGFGVRYAYVIDNELQREEDGDHSDEIETKEGSEDEYNPTSEEERELTSEEESEWSEEEEDRQHDEKHDDETGVDGIVHTGRLSVATRALLEGLKATRATGLDC